MSSSDLFFQHLAKKLLTEEVSMHEALKSFVNQFPQDDFAEVARLMAATAWEGKSIILAMEKFQGKFKNEEIELIRKGEKDGELLRYISELVARRST